MHLSATTTPPPVAEEALVLRDGTFVLGGPGETRRFNADLQLLGAHSSPLSGPADGAVVVRGGGVLYLDAFSAPEVDAMLGVPDSRHLCRFSRTPWGDELAFADQLRGRFAIGARPDALAMFGAYRTANAWQVSRFGPDCSERHMLTLPLQEQTDQGQWLARSLPTVTTSHDGQYAFVRYTQSLSGETTQVVTRLLRATGVQWTRFAPLSQASSAHDVPIESEWTLEPARDGGLLSLYGRELRRLDANGEILWTFAPEHPYTDSSWIQLDEHVGEDVWWTAEPVLAGLQSGVLLEYSDKRYYLLPSGVGLSEVDLAYDESPLAGKLLPGSEEEPIFSAQKRLEYVWSESSGAGTWDATQRLNALAWRFDALGRQDDLLPLNAEHFNEGLIAEGKLLQRAADDAALSVLDRASGNRSLVEPAVLGASTHVLGVHDSESGIYVVHGEESGPLSMTKLGSDGAWVWTRRLADEFLDPPAYDERFGAPAATSPHVATSAFAHNSDTVCAVFPADSMMLACLDQATGDARFAPVSLHEYGSNRGGRAILGTTAEEVFVTLNQDGSVGVVSLADAGPESSGALFAPAQMARKVFDAQGALTSSEVIASANAYSFYPVPAAAPSGTRLLTVREQPEASQRDRVCAESTDIAQRDVAGQLLMQQSVEGSWSAAALSDDGRMLLAGCHPSPEVTEWRGYSAEGAEVWRRSLAFNVQPKARALPGGDWLLWNDQFLLRLNGQDGSETWRTRIAALGDAGDLQGFPSVQVIESLGLVSTRLASRTHAVIAWSLLDGSPATALPFFEDIGSRRTLHPEPDPVVKTTDLGVSVSAFSKSAGDGLTLQAQHVRAIDQPNTQIDRHALRGYWHNDVTVGQGLVLDVAPDGSQVAGAWFTYTPVEAEAASEQRWYVVQGEIGAPGEPVELQVFAPAQGRFATTAAETSEPVGRIKLALHACDALLLTYAFDAGELEGLQGAVQLRRTAGEGDCMGAAAGQRTATDGAWYDPATSGQGIFFQTLPDGGEGVLVGAWFAFDPEGAVDDPLAQHWFTLLGTKSGAAAAQEMLIYRTIGGAFDQRATDNSHPVGRASFDAVDCAEGTLTYEFDDSEVTGSFAGLSGNIRMVNLVACSR